MRQKCMALAVLAVLACGAAVGLYFWLRGPMGGVTPYGTVNDLYDWEYMTFTTDKTVYPVGVKSVTLYFRNGAPDGVVWLSESPSYQWYLERETDGVWHSMRAAVEIPQWRFREEDCTLYSMPSGMVNWNGGEFTWYCDIDNYYHTPLEPGSYRIVIPDCNHRDDHGAIAVEFEVA